MGATGGVGPDEDLAAGSGARSMAGQLAQRLAQHADVVGGGVGPGVARTQQHRQRLAGAISTVVDKRPQRMVPVSALERRRGAFLVRVRGHQRRVDVDDQRRAGVDSAVGGALAGQLPGPRPSGRPRGRDRGERTGRIGGEPVDRPRYRRVRGHRAVDPGLGAHHGDVGQAVPTQRERHRQIEHDLRRVVHRVRQPPRPQRRKQLAIQPDRPNGLGEQQPTGLRHDLRAGGINDRARIEPTTLAHLEGAPDLWRMWTFDKSHPCCSGAPFSRSTRPSGDPPVKAPG